MNILPKKRWHVRTKDNIARVRRDEAKAAAELKTAEARALLAEQEARTSLLRNRARARVQFDCQDFPKEVQASGLEVSSESKHVNFFEDLEAGETTASGNKEHEAEKKKEQEEYEKKVGILTYLGQDTNELTGEKAWWQALPLDRRKALTEDTGKDEPSTSKSVVRKDALDPLNEVRRYLGCEGIQKIVKKSKALEVEKKVLKRKRRSSSSEKDKRKSKKSKKEKKHKKDKKRKKSKKKSRSSTESSDDEKDNQRKKLEKRARLERLRRERLEREKHERARTMRVLRGEKEESPPKVSKELTVEKNGQKYNNQFNPHLASQNKLNSNKKYWLE